MYTVHNGQLATQQSKFYWQQMSPECGTSKTKAKLQERRKVQIQCVQCSAFKPICLNIVIGHPICQILCITAIFVFFGICFVSVPLTFAFVGCVLVFLCSVKNVSAEQRWPPIAPNLLRLRISPSNEQALPHFPCQ